MGIFVESSKSAGRVQQIRTLFQRISLKTVLACIFDLVADSCQQLRYPCMFLASISSCYWKALSKTGQPIRFLQTTNNVHPKSNVMRAAYIFEDFQTDFCFSGEQF